MPYTPDTDPAAFDDWLIETKHSYGIRSPENTFGHNVVLRVNEAAAISEHFTNVDNVVEQLRLKDEQVKLGKLAAINLFSARKHLRDVYDEKDPQSYHYFNQYMSSSAPPFLVERFESQHPALPSEKDIPAEKRQNAAKWLEWFTTSDPDGVPFVSNETFINMLQWHNNVIEKQVIDPEIRAMFLTYTEAFIESALELHDAGVLAREPKETDGAKLIIGDVFEMVMRGQSGYYNRGSTEVVISQGVGRTTETQLHDFKEELQRILTHELTHYLLNYSFEKSGEAMATPWLNEALTEHISQLIRATDKSKVVDEGTYIEERQLLETLLSKDTSEGSREKAWKLATHGFSGYEKDFSEFTNYVDTIWNTYDAVEKIQTAIEQEEKRLRSSGVSEFDAARKAPEKVHELLKTNDEAVFHRAGDRTIFDAL